MLKTAFIYPFARNSGDRRRIRRITERTEFRHVMGDVFVGDFLIDFISEKWCVAKVEINGQEVEIPFEGELIRFSKNRYSSHIDVPFDDICLGEGGELTCRLVGVFDEKGRKLDIEYYDMSQDYRGCWGCSHWGRTLHNFQEYVRWSAPKTTFFNYRLKRDVEL